MNKKKNRETALAAARAWLNAEQSIPSRGWTTEPAVSSLASAIEAYANDAPEDDDFRERIALAVGLSPLVSRDALVAEAKDLVRDRDAWKEKAAYHEKKSTSLVEAFKTAQIDQENLSREVDELRDRNRAQTTALTAIVRALIPGDREYALDEVVDAARGVAHEAKVLRERAEKAEESLRTERAKNAAQVETIEVLRHEMEATFRAPTRPIERDVLRGWLSGLDPYRDVHPHDVSERDVDALDALLAAVERRK